MIVAERKRCQCFAQLRRNGSSKRIERQIHLSQPSEHAEFTRNGSNKVIRIQCHEGQSGELAQSMRNCTSEIIPAQIQRC